MSSFPKRHRLPKPFPWKVFYRALLLQAVVLILVLVASGITARHFFKQQFLSQVKTQLSDGLRILSRNLPLHLGREWCEANALGTEFRLTAIREDGKVICDSHHDPTTMEDHRSRPEVVSALRGEFGQSQRRSGTLGEMMFYGATFVPSSGLVLRGAIPLKKLSATMAIYDTSMFGGLILIAFLATLWSVWSARTIVFPLGRLLIKAQNLRSPEEAELTKADLKNELGDEWSELESHMDDIGRDLVEKTQSLSLEQVQLDTITGAISDAILAVDTEGVPLFYNSRFEILAGSGQIRKREIKLWEIFREPEILESFKAALNEGTMGASKFITLGTPERGKRIFSLSVSPLRNGRGTIYGAVGVFHDVTNLKSAEQMRIDFLANATHELRTPLTSIRGYGETLALDVKNGRPIDVEFIQAINRNTERLTALMNDLLDLSSIESIDILHKEHLGTEEITAKVLEPLQAAFSAKKQSIELNFEANEIKADPHRLEQVLVNLLVNANKYTPPAGTIRIDWTKEGHQTVLKVHNSGPGIPVEHHSRLFERFYRVDKARSREQGGTGLGLAIVKHIMERHGGVVWVKSEPGNGTTFLCRFP